MNDRPLSDSPDTWTVVGGRPPRENPSRRTQLFLWIFSILMVVTAGTAFIFKLIEFFVTATNEGPGALASFLIPVLTYVMVATGFMCLFFWAYSSGQFDDIEGPKYRLLEMADAWDRAEAKAMKDPHPKGGAG